MECIWIANYHLWLFKIYEYKVELKNSIYIRTLQSYFNAYETRDPFIRIVGSGIIISSYQRLSIYGHK